jgi:hypothetical protein
MLVDKNNVISGSFSIDGDLVVAGTLSGEAAVRGAFVVEKEGSAEGTVRCSRAVVAGRFSGALSSETAVHVEPGALIQGKVLAREVLFNPPEPRREAETTPSAPERIQKESATAPVPAAGKMPLVTGTSGKVTVRPTCVLKGSRQP